MTATTADSDVPDWHAPGVLHVVAADPEALQKGLDAAVLQLRETAANRSQRGILITRLSRSLFSVEVSADVPYGTTMEKDRWQRHAASTEAGTGDVACQ